MGERFASHGLPDKKQALPSIEELDKGLGSPELKTEASDEIVFDSVCAVTLPSPYFCGGRSRSLSHLAIEQGPPGKTTTRPAVSASRRVC